MQSPGGTAKSFILSPSRKNEKGVESPVKLLGFFGVGENKTLHLKLCVFFSLQFQNGLENLKGEVPVAPGSEMGMREG